jgi:hypothetical protein
MRFIQLLPKLYHPSSMLSGSQPSTSEPPPLPLLSNLIGTMIALFTLVAPIVIVKHFSDKPTPTVIVPAIVQGN